MGIWSAEKRALLRRLESPWGDAQTVAIGPESDQLATARGRTIQTWAIPRGEALQTLEGHSIRVTSLAYSHDGTRLASGDAAGIILIWNLLTGKIEGSLFDADSNPVANEGTSFEVEIDGRTITYTLPCGSPIPPNATCVCNCVPGSIRAARRYIPRNRNTFEDYSPSWEYTYPVRPYVPRYRGTRTFCTCDLVCTCIPVCQAHLLLHRDRLVRSMAEQLLLVMGQAQLTYMRWAARSARQPLQSRIVDMVARVVRGDSTDRDEWPTPAECCRLLHDDDEVIAVMAAQYLALYHKLDGPLYLSQRQRAHLDRVLRLARNMVWFTRPV
jgi:hypothetical protein